MNKDIIYIDVDDDVTSVIGKVRDAGEKIVALVPPKNIGALQSAVNLRLLVKAADAAGKRIVLITNNSALTALAAGVKIPVAKNLQSKPEIPSMPARDESTEEDVIKGDELPVGELAAATAAGAASEPATPIAARPVSALQSSADDIIVEDMPEDLEKPAPIAAAAATGAAKKPKRSRVPDFGRFRKAIFIGGGALVAIILFFVLTNIFLTSANIVIAAQTSDQPIDLAVTFKANGSTNPDQSTIASETKQTKKTATVDFTPTGKKNVGDKATGQVKFSNTSPNAATVPAGTKLTDSNNLVFTVDADVSVPAATLSFGCSGYICPSSANGSVTAAEGGTKYNGETGSLSGSPAQTGATFTGATNGGSDKTVTVVSGDDISAATAKLPQGDATGAKSDLTSQFGNGYVVIGDSFTSQDGDVTSSPAVGTEATTAKLSRESTYSLTAVSKDQIKVLTTAYLNSQTTGDTQKVYDDGSNGASIAQFATSPSGVMTGHIRATGKIGPNIDENALKQQSAGKKSGEITSEIQSIDGVKNVSVSFSPFWRTTAPSADKIKISFDINGGND